MPEAGEIVVSGLLPAERLCGECHYRVQVELLCKYITGERFMSD